MDPPCFLIGTSRSVRRTRWCCWQRAPLARITRSHLLRDPSTNPSQQERADFPRLQVCAWLGGAKQRSRALRHITRKRCAALLVSARRDVMTQTSRLRPVLPWPRLEPILSPERDSRGALLVPRSPGVPDRAHPPSRRPERHPFNGPRRVAHL